MSANEIATTATSSEVTLSVVMVTVLILLVVCNLLMYTVTRMLTDPKFCLRQMVQRYTQKVPRVRVLEVHPKPRTPSLIGHSHADLISLLSHSANLQLEGIPRETYSPTLQLESATREIIHSSLLQDEGITREITPVYTKEDEWEAANINMTITCEMQKVEFIQEDIRKQNKSDPNVTDMQNLTDSSLHVPSSRKHKEIEQPVQETKQKENGPNPTHTVPFPSKTVNKDKVQGKIANKDNRSISKGDNSVSTSYSGNTISSSGKRRPATGKVGGVRPGKQTSGQNGTAVSLNSGVTEGQFVTNKKQESIVNGNGKIEGHTDRGAISDDVPPVVQDEGVKTLSYTEQSQEAAFKDTTSTSSKDTSSTVSKDTTSTTSKDTISTLSKDTTLRSDTVPGVMSTPNIDTRTGKNSNRNPELGTPSSSNNEPETPPASNIEPQATNGSNIESEMVPRANIKNGTCSVSEIGQIPLTNTYDTPGHILLTNTYDTPVIKFFKEMKNENVETTDEVIMDGQVTEESEMTDGQTNKQDLQERGENQNLSEVNSNNRGNGATDSEVEISGGQIVSANGTDEQSVKETCSTSEIRDTELKDRQINNEQMDEESSNRTESEGQILVEVAAEKQTTEASVVADTDNGIKTDIMENPKGTQIKSGFNEQKDEGDSNGEKDKLSVKSNEGETSVNSEIERNVDMTPNEGQTMTEKEKVPFSSESDSEIKTEEERQEEELKILRKTDSEEIMKVVQNVEDSKSPEESDVEKDLTEYIRSNTMETNDDVGDKVDEKVVKEKVVKNDRVSSLKGAKPTKSSKNSKQEAVTTKSQAVRARNQATVRNGKRFKQLKLTQ